MLFVIQKAALKLNNSTKKNQLLSDNLNKFKKLISKIVYSNEPITSTKNLGKTSSIDLLISNNVESENISEQKLAALIISNLTEATRKSTDSKEAESAGVNEINILNFFNHLKQKIQHPPSEQPIHEPEELKKDEQTSESSLDIEQHSTSNGYLSFN